MSEHRHTDPDFLSEDFRFTATLLRGSSKPMPAGKDTAGTEAATNAILFHAVCSNNLSIILAALDAAAERKP